MGIEVYQGAKPNGQGEPGHTYTGTFTFLSEAL
jgi:hypothetical protein